MFTLAQGCGQGERQGARVGMGMLLTASIMCSAFSAGAQAQVWTSHQPPQQSTGSHEAGALVQHHLPTKWHAHHQPLVEPVSHRDCPLQPLRALQQAPGLAGPPADVLVAAALIMSRTRRALSCQHSDSTTRPRGSSSWSSLLRCPSLSVLAVQLRAPAWSLHP